MISSPTVPAHALRVLRPAPTAALALSPIARSGAVPRSALLSWLATSGHAASSAWRHSIAVSRMAGTSAVPWLLRISESSLRSCSAPLFGMVPACAGVPHPHRAQNLAGCRPRQGGRFVKRSFMNTPFTRAVPCESLASKRDGGLPRSSPFDALTGLTRWNPRRHVARVDTEKAETRSTRRHGIPSHTKWLGDAVRVAKCEPLECERAQCERVQAARVVACPRIRPDASAGAARRGRAKRGLDLSLRHFDTRTHFSLWGLARWSESESDR